MTSLVSLRVGRPVGVGFGATMSVVAALTVVSLSLPGTPEPGDAPSAAAILAPPVSNAEVFVAVPASDAATPWIAYSAVHPDGVDRLHVVSPDGTDDRVLVEGWDARQRRAWALDGSALVFCARLDEASVAPVSSCPEESGLSTTRQPPAPGPVLDAPGTLSPTGRWLASFRAGAAPQRTATLVALDLVTQQLHTVVTLEHARSLSFDWSPDGSALAYATPYPAPEDTADIWVAGLDGSAPRRVTTMSPGAHASWPSFSANGEWLAYRVDGDGPTRIMRIRLAGGDPELVAEVPGLSPRDLDWGP